MTHRQEKLLADLEFRINQLIYLCDSLKEENLSLKVLVDEKNLEIELANAKLAQLEQKYNNLKVAQAMVSGREDDKIDLARARLNKLIQDVDKCITLLKV